MSDHVQFDEDQVGVQKRSARPGMPSSMSAGPAFGQSQSTGMAGWLIRHGIMSSDSGAKFILMGIVCINFIAAGLIIYFFVLR